MRLADAHPDVLIFAADHSVIPGVEALAEQHDWHIANTRSLGEALRQFLVRQPRAVVLTTTPRSIGQTSAMIEQLRRRRPDVALIAVTAEHDEKIERGVRRAGAACYLPLGKDAASLLGVLRSLNLLSGRVVPRRGRSPPHTTAPPEPQARGQPGRRLLSADP